ncbi:PadR family transcriptional regulator [Pradoshia sp. D12]|uniref:PadR family transcriptional regulator n=1 Tax=Bacillaceae TaxID=186817 RepID=UPI00111E057A|nr:MULTISPECIES: PadR family transcriptional regulator [Bacillaceae]QFK71367.1 PadR family transcriptional regulator [Pradoshia sp. D12]TPF73162.1 PadR family transcriptional regulator [Bacillus sp. D12]
MDELIQSLIIELRRGTLTLAVLSQLQKPEYGYSLVQSLEEKNVTIDPSTLYPLLRRLEKQGLLVSDWKLNGNRQRKYYQLSHNGKQIYEKLKEAWSETSNQMVQLLREDECDEFN